MKQGSLYPISGNQILNSFGMVVFSLFICNSAARERVTCRIGDKQRLQQACASDQKTLCISSTIGYCEHAIKVILLNTLSASS